MGQLNHRVDRLQLPGEQGYATSGSCVIASLSSGLRAIIIGLDHAETILSKQKGMRRAATISGGGYRRFLGPAQPWVFAEGVRQ